ncbi:hypothetical protein EPIR_1161 [Erwinia piriflorinigrans CFBP 5888]|uniref:Uncharacterized protein n=1 Tax=Erwinia piriflorinigrans CFBP 5888 TaxID=1161919 RepID=V5Z5D0_9GAMM|nr:hypothetical protein EPIR_1161 [Erwinia piriflorinigrans CFBP 5888]
MIVSYKAFAS